MADNFYAYEAETLQGEKIPMKEYEGKAVLVVNTASKCGFTPQYKGLESLYQEYKTEGLVVLGFPCNQFGSQEPGDAEQITEFCEVNYGVSFPMFSKVDVNGSNAHPIFQYLKTQKGGILGNNIKWNFTKFLVDKNGKPVKRYASTTKPESIKKDIEAVLKS